MKKTHATGLLVSFEGTEGSGKSTLTRILSQLLTEKGYPALSTREPGGIALAESLRDIILYQSMNARTELFLYEAARAEHWALKVRPALEQGSIVICDRFTDSTLAYQSQARGLPWEEVQLLNGIATEGTQPDLTFFLDIDPAEGLKRSEKPNRFEAEGVAFQEKVRAGYLKAIEQDAQRWKVLATQEGTPEQLAHKILPLLVSHWETKRNPSYQHPSCLA